MNLISKIENKKNEILGQVEFDSSLAKYSWFNLGGLAKVIFKPKSLNDLSLFLKNIKGFKKIKVLGRGSNTLIRDGGFDGVIIKLGQPFSKLSMFDKNTIIAGSATLDKNLSEFALENSLTGFEFLSCIPGTIGGGIRMNSGCYGENISKILLSVQVMDFDGRIRVIPSSNINFIYRGCNLDNDFIFISATFKGKGENQKNIKNKMNKLIEQKKKDQPSKIKTCGSTFKNPDGKKAWKLIKDSGCAGMSMKGASISKKHCNFFINNGNAKAQDLESLINKVRSTILDKTGINLELELHIIGDKL
jgi:UDP-N-acetylmuramate dehydrogenase